jgi:hypothetical protein
MFLIFEIVFEKIRDLNKLNDENRRFKVAYVE